MTAPRTWRKSSLSGPNGDCVELPGTLDAVRDSKAPGTVLKLSRRAVAELVAAIRE